jgi:hypothetical protein
MRDGEFACNLDAREIAFYRDKLRLSDAAGGDKNWIVPDAARPRKNIVIGPRSEVRDRLPEIIAQTR